MQVSKRKFEVNNGAIHGAYRKAAGQEIMQLTSCGCVSALRYELNSEPAMAAITEATEDTTGVTEAPHGAELEAGEEAGGAAEAAASAGAVEAGAPHLEPGLPLGSVAQGDDEENRHQHFNNQEDYP